jgi:pilus assembly protein CpaE/pilus assembly protein CpaF
LSSETTGHIITVHSGKGACGKTLFAVNLAISLLRESKGKVLLLDMGLPLPGDAAQLLGLDKTKAIADLIPLLGRLQPALVKGYFTHHSSGIDVLVAINESFQSKLINEGHVNRVMNLVRGGYNYVVVDTSTDLDSINIEIFDNSDVIALLVTPDMLSVTRARRKLEYLQSLHFAREIFRVVSNRVTAKTLVSPEVMERSLNLPLSVQIPEDGDAISLSMSMATPLVLMDARHPITRAIDATSQMLHQQLRTDTRRLGAMARQQRGASVPEFRASAGPVPAAAGGAVVVPISGERSTEEKFLDVKLRIHKRLVDELKIVKSDLVSQDPSKVQEVRQRAEMKIVALLDEELKGLSASREQRKLMVKEVIDEALGLGPLEDMLADADITEIMVNRIDQIYVERRGKIELSKGRFLTNEQLRGVIERIVAPLGRRIDEKSPMVDARLSDGSRVNAIIPPLALGGPCLTIRKFPKKRLKVEDLIQYNTLTNQMSQLMAAAVRARQNVVISGGTGSGKTTLLNILSSFIPADERIVTVEDSAELQLPQDHVVRLESRPPNIEGEGAITIRDLVRNCLRMRPDRIVVGECRGGEALDMLQAMNTGHDGSLTTVHANTPRDALSRLETMSLMAGLDLPSKAIRDQIASAIQIVVQESRLADGSRKITHISEVTGQEGNIFTMSDIFIFKQTGMSPEGKVLGQFVPTGIVPKFVEKLQQRGIIIPREIFLIQTA